MHGNINIGCDKQKIGVAKAGKTKERQRKELVVEKQ